ncbi:hypothetical protein JZ785_14375 [Alicyclobacillus curvatus]|nr:hypothetical protein JZ785_14375 [Alicyclobacillus curvatus]
MSEISLDGVPVDTWIVRAQKSFLQDMGIHIAGDDIRRLREALISSYLLHSGVCVASSKTQRGASYVLVTKNPVIASSLQLAPAVRRKGMNAYDTQFAISYEEIRTGSFSAVSLSADLDGVRLGKLKVSARSARDLVPYYSLQNFAASLMNILGRRKVLLTYQDTDGVQKELLTTLINAAVAEWKGTTIEGAESMKIADWRDPASLGYMSLPSLSERGQFVSVPILGIIGMQPAKGV